MGGRAAALALSLLILAAAGLGGWWLTPHDHVAGGCFWWTAKQVGDVVAGDKGCVRGYVTVGSGLAESRDPSAYSLSFDQTQYRACALHPGDAVVFRYFALFDDGRTIIEVTDCE
jgi:hypothetical protein